jgi:hypothetical protein
LPSRSSLRCVFTVKTAASFLPTCAPSPRRGTSQPARRSCAPVPILHQSGPCVGLLARARSATGGRLARQWHMLWWRHGARARPHTHDGGEASRLPAHALLPEAVASCDGPYLLRCLEKLVHTRMERTFFRAGAAWHREDGAEEELLSTSISSPS